MNKSKPKFKNFAKRYREEIRTHKGAFVVYLILRASVIGVAIISFISGNYQNFFLCILSLFLFLLPAFVTKNFGIEFPETLEIIVFLFIYAAEILGEISGFYVKIKIWDTILHTTTGFLAAAIGFALLDILNRNEHFKFQISPVYMAVVAFCFSMTVGAVWELFEFSMDMLLGVDMQKDTVVQAIGSVSLDPAASNEVVRLEGIRDTLLVLSDGSSVSLSSLGVEGYLDIGIIDTMKDLLVNMIGAFAFSVIGYFYIKSRGKGKFAKKFIPTLKE
ncbi:MAG: hypothetical protein IKL24_00025 [Clostridia bacterium]|nr:hypothetical protein [Clostridia bacterium]